MIGWSQADGGLDFHDYQAVDEKVDFEPVPEDQSFEFKGYRFLDLDMMSVSHEIPSENAYVNGLEHSMPQLMGYAKRSLDDCLRGCVDRVHRKIAPAEGEWRSLREREPYPIALDKPIDE
jgi:hypothetical protein